MEIEQKNQFLSKENVLKEFEFLQENKKNILRSIKSNQSSILAQYKSMVILAQKGLEDIEDLIEFDICLGKVNTFIAMAFLNMVEDNQVEFKYLTRLPALLFKMHLNKLKIIKNMRIRGIFNHLVNLPGEIGLLSNLRELDINYCGLTLLPKEIGQLKKLEKLNLNDNLFTILPKEIGELTSLIELNICNNPHLVNLPEEIGNLMALEILNVHHDKLENIPSSFSQLKALREINLDFNQFIVVPPEISDMINLEKIYLRHNRLKALSLVLAKLKKLRIIDVKENEIENLSEEFISYLH